MAQYTSLDRDLLNQTCWVEIADTGDIPKDAQRNFMEWMLAEGTITHNVPDNELYDVNFTKYANRVLGDAPGTG